MKMTVGKALRILGLSAGAGPDAVKRAYRRAAVITHPDKEGGSAEAFCLVKNAYDCLVEYGTTDTGRGPGRRRTVVTPGWRWVVIYQPGNYYYSGTTSAGSGGFVGFVAG